LLQPLRSSFCYQSRSLPLTVLLFPFADGVPQLTRG
jgi:hypothetical protein